MFIKLIGAIACASLLVVIGFQSLINRQQSKPAACQWKDRNSLQEVARRNKAEGRAKVELRGPIIDYPGVAMNLDEALRDYSVVLAEPITSKSYIVNSDGVRTWYKFKLSEILSSRNWQYCNTGPEPIAPPQELLPLNPDEFLVATSGGTVNVDGVDITLAQPELPPFKNGKQYLLFVSLSPERVAKLGGGPSGVFSITQSDDLEPIGSYPYPIRNEMKRRFNLKLSQLNSHLKR